jgi:nicotinamidase-related amidase
LILLDAQRNRFEGDSPVAGAGELRPRLASLLERARAAGTAVVHVQNEGPAGDPDEPGTPGWELTFDVREGETVLRKSVPDAFAADPKLAASLREHGIEEVVVAGAQSEFCVDATARGALAAEFRTVLAGGAHGTYPGGDATAEEVAAAVEDELVRAGVQIIPAEDVLFDRVGA